MAIATAPPSVLPRREGHLRLVIDTIPTMAWSLQPDGAVDFVNQRWLEYTGMSFEEAVEGSIRIVHPDDLSRAVEKWRVDMAAGRPGEDEMRLRRADGEYRWFLVRTVPLRNEKGHIVKWYGTSTDIEDRKRAADALHDTAGKLQALTRRLVELQEKERREIALELHDRVGQSLTAMRIDMDLIRTRLNERDDPLIRARNDDCLQLIESVFQAVRNVMYELRPPMLDDYGLVASLQWYAKQFTVRTGIGAEIRGVEGWRCGPEVEIALFRIAQEALNNVARHSRAKNVLIDLRGTAEEAVFTIEDDGAGLGRERGRVKKTGYGLATMRERAKAVGGTFEATSEKRRGTRITVKLQLGP
jgi:two-component system sensor histidine kinase UhpB